MSHIVHDDTLSDPDIDPSMYPWSGSYFDTVPDFLPSS